MERMALFTVFLIGVILVFALGPDVESSDVEMKLLGRVGKKIYYRSVNSELSWQSSLQLCKSSGLQMGSIESEAEQLGLNSLLKYEYVKTSRLWTAGFRYSENAFAWLSSGAEFKYTNWADGEPNNLEDDEDCVEIYLYKFNNIVWNDNRCDYPSYTLCEGYAANPTTGEQS